jgi:glycosyltransferase involved in cell wall biosynthesis
MPAAAFLQIVTTVTGGSEGDAEGVRDIAPVGGRRGEYSGDPRGMLPMSGLLPARIAVVHEWLLDFAGSESVLAEVLQCFPEADLFALVDRMPPADRARLGDRQARTTFLQKMPGIASRLKYYLPLMPFAIEQIDLTGYDLVISSSHAVAKGVIVPPDALHVSYVHSPMRYAWDLQFAYLRDEGLERGARSLLARWLLHRMRIWDHRSAAGVDCFIAGSHFVARRILKAYRRGAQVIHPPVDTGRFRPGERRTDEYLAVSRLWGYKRIDLLVEAFAAMPDRRLVVIGDGPELARLRSSAPANVALLGYQPAAVVLERMQCARAFMFAGVEDFGIAPVEALACGTPVIALRRGGAAETCAGLDSEQPTGVFFEEQSAAAIVEAVKAFEESGGRISSEACRLRAERFSAPRFRSEFRAFVERKYAAWLDYRRNPGARWSDVEG